MKALIEQENFTNITVIAEDVALVGERVSDHCIIIYIIVSGMEPSKICDIRDTIIW